MAHRRAPTSATRSTPRTGAKTRAMSSNIGDRELAPELTLRARAVVVLLVARSSRRAGLLCHMDLGRGPSRWTIARGVSHARGREEEKGESVGLQSTAAPPFDSLPAPLQMTGPTGTHTKGTTARSRRVTGRIPRAVPLGGSTPHTSHRPASLLLKLPTSTCSSRASRRCRRRSFPASGPAPGGPAWWARRSSCAQRRPRRGCRRCRGRSAPPCRWRR